MGRYPKATRPKKMGPPSGTPLLARINPKQNSGNVFAEGAVDGELDDAHFLSGLVLEFPVGGNNNLRVLRIGANRSAFPIDSRNAHGEVPIGRNDVLFRVRRKGT